MQVTTVTHCPQPALEITNFPQHPPARSTRSSVAWADGSLSTPAGDKVKRMTTDDVDATPVPEEETVELTASNQV